MGNYRKLLSLMICAVLFIGMAVPAFAADVAAAPVKGGDPLAGIDASNYNVWRYESSDTLNGVSATLNAYVTRDGVRTTEMKYTVDPNYGVKCAATVYEPVGGELGLGDHRITTAFVGANKLIVDCNYIAVTYLTECGDKHGLVFRNTGGAGSVTLTDDTSASDGKWTTVYAPITDADKTNIITRMNKSFGNMGLVWDGAADANETLYVREIVFFKNAADAKTYAAASPVCYNGDAYVAPKDEPKEEPKTEAEDKPSAEVAVPAEAVQEGNKLIYDSYDPFTVLDPKSYIVWRYESAETLNSASATINTYVPKNGTPTKEMQYTVDPKFGVKCAVTVCEPVGGVLGLGNHRVTTCFVGANKLTVDLNYVAVTYFTKSSEKYGLVFRNTGGAGSVTLTDDTSASFGKWVTVYAPITDSNKTNIVTRMNKSYGNMGLMWEGAKKADEALYVREIVFFENEADAALYAEVAPAYYMGTKVVKKLPKTEEQQLKLNLMAGVIAAMRGAKWAVEDEKRTTLPTEWIEYAALYDMRSASALDKTSATHADSGVVTYITEKNDEAAKLEFTPGTSEYGYYRIAFTPDAVDGIDAESGDYYAAVTYRADTEAALTLKAGNDSLMLADKTAVSEKWQTVPVKIDANSDILKALADGNGTVALCWGQDAPSGTVEIKELVFFLYESRAADYEKYAPIYYNSFYDFIPKNPLDEIQNEVLIDLSSVAKLKTMLMLRDTADTRYCSVLEDVEIDGISAIKLVGAATSVNNYRRFQFWGGPVAKAELSANLKDNYYVAITYMTDGVGDLKLYRNAGGANVFGTTATSDKWQTLVSGSPVDSTLLDTLMNNYGSNVSVEWANADQSKNIIIKEIVFFNSKVDAEKYGDGAAKYYNYTAGYEEADAPQTGAPETPLSGISKYDKWTFDSEATLNSVDGSSLVRNAMADTSLITRDPNFAVKSLKLKYSTKSNVNTYWSQVQFNYGGNKLLVTPNFIAVTYLTSDSTQAGIGFNAITAGGVIVEDTSSSNGRWTTGYVKLTDDQSSAIAARLSGGGKAFAITWSNTATNSEIYIREVVFFENEADAIAYTEKAPVYYNYAEDYSWNVDPLSLTYTGEKVVWSYTSTSIGANGAHIQGGASIVNDPIFGYACAKVTDKMFQCRYNAANQFTIANPRYVAMTYMTPDTAQYSYKWAYINGSHTQSSNISVSNGRWVTEYVKLDDAAMAGLKTRLNKAPGSNHVIMQVFDETTNIIPANLYVRDIIFFEKEADAQAYAKQAQLYYNYYSK